MPQYIKDIPEYVPQIQPWQPNLQLYQNALLRRQKQYDTNFDKVNSLYGSLFNSDLTRPSDIQMRDEFLKLADFEIKRLSSVDLSNQQNLRAATDLFKPLYENENFIHDVSYTKKLKSAYGQADALKRCTDPEKCDGMYWDGGVQHLNYQAQDYANSTDEEALSMRAPSYVPAQNLAKDATKLLKDAGFETKVVTFKGNKGQYIFTTENGAELKAPLTSYLNSVFANDPKYTSYYNVKADLRKRSWLGENEKYFATPEEAESKYAMNALNALYDIYDEQDLQVNKASNQIDQELSLFDKFLNNFDDRDNLKAERVAQLQSEKQVVEAEKQRLAKVNYLLNNGIDINDISTYKDRINSIVAQELLQTEINGFAKSWQEGRVKQEVKINQFAKSGYDHELALNRMDHQYELDIRKMIAKNELEGNDKNKKLTKEEKALNAYEKYTEITYNNDKVISEARDDAPLNEKGKKIVETIDNLELSEKDKAMYIDKNYSSVFLDNIAQNTDLYKMITPGLFDILGVTDPIIQQTMKPSDLKNVISALPDDAGEGKPSIKMINSYIDGLMNSYNDYQPDLNSPEAKNAGLYPTMLNDKQKEVFNMTTYNMSQLNREKSKSYNKLTTLGRRLQNVIDKNINRFYHEEIDGKLKYDGDYETKNNIYPKEKELSPKQINSMLIDWKGPVGYTLKTEDEFIKDYLGLVESGQVTGNQGSFFIKGVKYNKYLGYGWTEDGSFRSRGKKIDKKKVYSDARDIYQSASNGFYEFLSQHAPDVNAIDGKGGSQQTARTANASINTKMNESSVNQQFIEIADVIKNDPTIEISISEDTEELVDAPTMGSLVLDELTAYNSKGYDFKVEFNPIYPLDGGTDADPDYSYFKVTPDFKFVKANSGTEDLPGLTDNWSEYKDGVTFKIPKDKLKGTQLYAPTEDRANQNLLQNFQIDNFSNTAGTITSNVVEENGEKYIVVNSTIITNNIVTNENGKKELVPNTVQQNPQYFKIEDNTNFNDLYDSYWAALEQQQSYNINITDEYYKSIKK